MSDLALVVDNSPKRPWWQTHLSSKFKGPDAFARQSTGEFWSVLHVLDRDEVRVQEALTGKRAQPFS